jgi:hypothetical protein
MSRESMRRSRRDAPVDRGLHRRPHSEPRLIGDAKAKKGPSQGKLEPRSRDAPDFNRENNPL